MDKWGFTRTVGGMLNLIATAVGYGLDISQTANIGPKWWLLITLLLGIGLVGWVIWELHSQLNERPSVTVKSIKEGDTYCLLVTNKGAFASFTSQITLTTNDPSVSELSTLSCYQGLWDSPQKIKADIPKGQSAKVKIADINLSSLGWEMEIYYYQSPNGDGRIRANPYWRGTITKENTGETRPLEPPDAHLLVVTISGKPDLKEGFFKKKYQLGYDGLVLASKTKS